MQHVTGPALITLALPAMSAMVRGKSHDSHVSTAWAKSKAHPQNWCSPKDLCGSSSLNRHLSSHLHHPAGRYLEEVGGVARRPRERNEQPVLPARDAGV